MQVYWHYFQLGELQVMKSLIPMHESNNLLSISPIQALLWKPVLASAQWCQYLRVAPFHMPLCVNILVVVLKLSMLILSLSLDSPFYFYEPF
jgi:hypothetical protein